MILWLLFLYFMENFTTYWDENQNLGLVHMGIRVSIFF
jgi:hypothetical protein